MKPWDRVGRILDTAAAASATVANSVPLAYDTYSNQTKPNPYWCGFLPN